VTAMLFVVRSRWGSDPGSHRPCARWTTRRLQPRPHDACCGRGAAL